MGQATWELSLEVTLDTCGHVAPADPTAGHVHPGGGAACWILSAQEGRRCPVTWPWRVLTVHSKPGPRACPHFQVSPQGAPYYKEDTPGTWIAQSLGPQARAVSASRCGSGYTTLWGLLAQGPSTRWAMQRALQLPGRVHLPSTPQP